MKAPGAIICGAGNGPSKIGPGIGIPIVPIIGKEFINPIGCGAPTNMGPIGIIPGRPCKSCWPLGIIG